MDLLTFLSHPQNGLPPETARQLAAHWQVSRVEKGGNLTRQGAADGAEYILLDGRVTSQISDPEGRSVCVGFYSAPCVITPNLARSRNGLSLVSLEVCADALVARMDSAALTELMLVSEPIREWANAVLQDTLFRKADREWALAALGGAERLIWFRQTYADYEDQFAHGLIASFLGVTPVTLSRLRTQSREGTP